MRHFNVAFRFDDGSGRDLIQKKRLLEAENWVVIYVDDVLVQSSSRSGHVETLRCIFFKLQAHGWTINPE